MSYALIVRKHDSYGMVPVIVKLPSSSSSTGILGCEENQLSWRFDIDMPVVKRLQFSSDSFLLFQIYIFPCDGTIECSRLDKFCGSHSSIAFSRTSE